MIDPEMFVDIPVRIVFQSNCRLGGDEVRLLKKFLKFISASINSYKNLKI